MKEREDGGRRLDWIELNWIETEMRDDEDDEDKLTQLLIKAKIKKTFFSLY